jgi:glycosyltransferase involved in cell wall biosynthesis
VIGARAGGIPGVIDDRRDGLLVEYGDVPGLARAMARLIEDPETARRLGEAGRSKLTADYTWDRVLARHEAVYTRVAPHR